MDFTIPEQRNEFMPGSLKPCAIGELQQLLLWRNWRKTALIFCLLLTLLMDIAVNSFISVISVAGILVLFASFGYYCIVWGIRKLRKSSLVDHPHQYFLDIKWSISEQRAQCLASLIVQKLNPNLLRLRSLILIEDPVDSLKLLFLLCGLNIVGDYINGMSLLLAGCVLLFTLPKLYEWKKSFINMQLQHLQHFKSRFLSNKKKIRFAEKTSGPEAQCFNSNQIPNINMNNECEMDESADEFPSYEEASDNVFLHEFCWPPQIMINKQQKKET